MDDLKNLVNPKTVAVIGASADPKKIGHQIIRNIVEGKFQGEIYPVNPKGGVILDLDVYTDISEIEKKVDLAIVVLPSGLVKAVLEQCAKQGVKAVIVISSGFAEVGPAGQRLQEEIVEICRNAGITMLGPNCLGLINTKTHLNASFAASMPKNGNIAFVSQSGAMISALIDWTDSNSYGLSKVFSMGNMALLDERAVLEYLYKDSETKVILCYLEQLRVNKELTSTLIKYAKTKPTVVLFGGKTNYGAKAASSHTGSIVSSYLAVKTYLEQAGIIVASGLNELFTYAQIFSNFQKIEGNRFAIVTNAGGPSIAVCDALAEKKIALAELSEETKEALSLHLNPNANINNPIDLLGDASAADYETALRVIVKSKCIDGVFVLVTPQSSTEIEDTAKAIAVFGQDKPIIPIFIGGDRFKGACQIIEKANKPCFQYPEEGVEAASALVNFSSLPKEIINDDDSSENLDFAAKIDKMNEFGLPTLKYVKCETFEEVKKAAEEIGFPVVMKTAKSEEMHKSESGGVKLNIVDNDYLKKCFDELGSPVIVGQMVSSKHEIFLGIKKDRNIGTVVAFGSGGIYSELYGDFSYRIAPITFEVAKEMIFETKMGEILNGARGQKVYDIEKLAHIIVQAAKFANHYTNIKEIDFNPILASESEYFIVDARLIEN